MNYTESDAYQREIAEQYTQRTLQLAPVDVHQILQMLGIEVSVDELSLAQFGNMNATYSAGPYVVKISNDDLAVKYSANKVVSEQLPHEKVVRVVLHDVRERTDYEVLVMERAPGDVWLTQMPLMSEAQNVQLFKHVVQVARAAQNISVTNSFGWVTDILHDPPAHGFATYQAQLAARLDAYLPKIVAQEDLDQTAVEHTMRYVRENLDLFADEQPRFVHTDLHMGNVLQSAGELTAVIDWDSVQSAPAYRGLIPLVGLIDNPAQFVEGTPDYELYKGKKFEYLYPILKEAFATELADPYLARKMNVCGIIEGLMWVSEDWSREWNKEMITNLATQEVPDDGDVSHTYWGRILTTLHNA